MKLINVYKKKSRLFKGRFRTAQASWWRGRGATGAEVARIETLKGVGREDGVFLSPLPLVEGSQENFF